MRPAKSPHPTWDGESWNSPPKQAILKEKKLRQKIEKTVVKDSNNLVNRIGQIALSGEGLTRLLQMRKFYGSSSASYALDRLLRNAALRRVVTSLVVSAEDYVLWEKEAKARGFADAEALMEDSINTASKKMRERDRVK